MLKKIVCLSFICSVFVANSTNSGVFCIEDDFIKTGADSASQNNAKKLDEDKDKYKENLAKDTSNVLSKIKNSSDAHINSSSQKEAIDFSKIKDRKELVKIINAIPEKERPSLERDELIVNEDDLLDCEDKIYNPRFWRMSLEKKLEYMKYLGNEAKIKVIRFFRNTEKAYALVLYRRKLFALEDQIVTLYQKIVKIHNFYEILIENSNNKSFLRGAWDFLFSRKKDLSDQELDTFCSPKVVNSLENNFGNINEDYEEEKLKNVLEDIEDAEKDFDVLKKKYNSELLRTLEEFKKGFPNIKSALLNFYGEDAINKFDCKKVDFKDKKIPREIRILANAQKILDVDIKELLKD